MYVRRHIRFQYVLAESWAYLILVTVWSITVVCLHEIAGFKWLVMPVLPVTLIGIAVSLYGGFKGVSAYNRWWEARSAIGSLTSESREWVMQVQSLIYNGEEPVPNDIVRALLYRHLGWVFAVVHMLRKKSRLKASKRTRIFQYRPLVQNNEIMHRDPQSYGQFLDPEEFAASQTFSNPANYLLRQQARSVKNLTTSGYLDSMRQTTMNDVLARLDHSHGICLRIKETPFPRQIAFFGTIFTWIFIFLLPLSFLDVFEAEATQQTFSTIITHKFMFTLVPFAALISWVFLMMEKVSDSCEDPFEGGVNDVPLSAACRLLEIHIRQVLEEKDIPQPLEPVDDAIY